MPTEQYQFHSESIISEKVAFEKELVRMLKPEDPSDHMNLETPEANGNGNGYELRSEHVIDMLKQLLTKFRQERTEAEPEEKDSIQSHEMLMADMTQRIESKENRLKVVKSFQRKASILKSVALKSLVVSVTDDPFVKVKDMIYA